MAIPKYNEIQLPVLKILSDGKILKLKDFIEPISNEFSLTNEEINEMYPSGNGHILLVSRSRKCNLEKLERNKIRLSECKYSEKQQNLF